MFSGNFVLTRPRQNSEKRAGAGGSLSRGRPRVAQKIDGLIRQTKTFLDKPGRAKNVILCEAFIDNPSNRAGRPGVLTESLIQFGNLKPAPVSFVAFNRLEQQSAF